MRGFATVQQIDIESLALQKKNISDRNRESDLVGLAMEESALSRLIEALERKVEQRCNKYDENNVYWGRVDNLLEQQPSVLKQMRSMNKSLLSSTKVESKPMHPLNDNASSDGITSSKVSK